MNLLLFNLDVNKVALESFYVLLLIDLCIKLDSPDSKKLTHKSFHEIIESE